MIYYAVHLDVRRLPAN